MKIDQANVMAYYLPTYRYSEIEKQTIEDLLQYSSLLLPISIDEIIENIGIKMKAYSDLSSKKMSLLTRLGASTDNGFSVNNGKGEWRIFYDKTGYECRDNSTKAHELGHVRMEHSERSDLAEAEANVYMSRIMAPYPLLCAMEVQNADDPILFVANKFNLSIEMSQNTVKRFFSRKMHGSAFAPYEQKLFDKFMAKLKKGGNT